MHLRWLRPAGLTLALGLGSYLAPAQTFEPGYLVLSRGDTLRGDIQNEFWADPPTQIRLRREGHISTYPAHQLRAVGLGSGRLLRHERLPLDRAAETDVNRLTVGAIFAQEPDSVLADVLVEGPASLLGVSLNNVKHFFVRRPGREYLEMTERRYLVLRDGVRRIADGNNYHSQLLMYFGDCPAAVQRADAAAFTAPALAEVVQTFNRECTTGGQPGRRIAPERRPPVKLQVGATLGMRYNSLRLRTDEAPGQEQATLDGLELDGRLHTQVGAFMDLVHPGRRLALHLALLHAAYGRETAVPSPDGSAQWQGRVSWRGRTTTAQLGLRWLRPVGAHYQLLLGSGAERILHWRSIDEALQYGNGAPDATRTVNGNRQLLTRAVLIAGFNTTLRPYVEVGVRRDRLTLTLTGRSYGKEYFYDHMVHNQTITNNLGSYTTGYSYQGRTFSLALALSYRLNGDSDTHK